MWSRKLLVSVTASIATMLMILTGNLAVAATDGGLEEMVVTAQRREQNLQDVGISVTAFSGTQVQELGFVNTVDVAHMTPNLNYTVPQAESSQINFFLRGVGLNDFNANSIRPPVSPKSIRLTPMARAF